MPDKVSCLRGCAAVIVAHRVRVALPGCENRADEKSGPSTDRNLFDRCHTMRRTARELCRRRLRKLCRQFDEPISAERSVERRLADGYGIFLVQFAERVAE